MRVYVLVRVISRSARPSKKAEKISPAIIFTDIDEINSIALKEKVWSLFFMFDDTQTGISRPMDLEKSKIMLFPNCLPLWMISNIVVLAGLVLRTNKPDRTGPICNRLQARLQLQSFNINIEK